MTEEQNVTHAQFVAAVRSEIKRLTEELVSLQKESESKCDRIDDRINQLEALVEAEPKVGRPVGSTKKKAPPQEPSGEPTPEEQAALEGKEVIEA